jgi:DNA-binding NtrC family response regulator/tetratricopeptide (TPR) repeat protein
VTLDYQASKELARTGRFVELLEKTDSDPSALTRLSIEHQLLLAEIFLHTGQVDLARKIAASHKDTAPSPASRAKSEFILGVSEPRHGNATTSFLHLQHAIRLSLDAKDVESAAWAQLYVFRGLAEGHSHSQDELAAQLSVTRRLITRAGHPHLAAYLHDCVSLREALSGRLEESQRHLAIAKSLLDQHPTAWIRQIVEISSACVCCLSCQFDEAKTHAQEARRLGRLTGHQFASRTLDINEAHISLLTGDFGQARLRLDRLAKETSGGALSLSSLEGLARACLAMNDLVQCEDVLARLHRSSDGDESRDLFPVRRAAITRGRLLLRRGDLKEAISVTERSIKDALNVGDLPLAAGLILVQAEALAMSGNVSRGAQRLRQAMDLAALENPEQRGHFYSTSAEVLSAVRTPVAAKLRARADRVWTDQRNALARAEALIPNRVETTTPKTSSVGPALSQRPAPDPADVINTVAALFDLASSPKLVAAELVELIRSLGCAEQVRAVIRKTSLAETNSATMQARCTIPVGDYKGKSLQIESQLIDEPLNQVVFGDVLRIARSALELARYRAETRSRAALWPSSEEEGDGLLFVCDETVNLWKTGRKVAPTNIPILITGETGTGKEILARAIHVASPRATATFMPFNCSAGPKDMFDAQLFGHRRGAFTGAAEHAPGVIRAAAGGTLFLDEIGEAPLDVQPKLLRFLESGEIHPLGESHPVRADVRVIAATNLDLDVAVSSGKFREDLFYRLNIVRLHLPPLRERRVEIPVFAQHYLEKYAAELNKGNLRLAEETMEYLLLYRWPGNVRQLANEMRRIVALAETDAVLMPEHLAAEIAASRRTIPASERQLEPTEVVVRLDQPLAAATQHLERAMLIHAFRVCGGRVEDTARLLGLSRKGLYLKRQRLGLEPPATHAKTA